MHGTPTLSSILHAAARVRMGTVPSLTDIRPATSNPKATSMVRDWVALSDTLFELNGSTVAEKSV